MKYKNGNRIQIISQIESEKTWKYKIDSGSIEGEDAIILIYKDKQGNSYEEYVVGYLEKGYNGKVDVNINKIDENRKLDIEIRHIIKFGVQMVH